MYKINTEGTSFLYDSNFQYKNENIIISQDALDFLKLDELKKIIRPILTEHYSSKILFFLDYLYWFDGKVNLQDIDNKVVNNNYSNDDFKHSIKTKFVSKLTCLKCKSEYKSLVVDPVTIYPGNFNLINKKKELFNSLNNNCPKCGHNFTLFVVHIFGYG